LGTTRGNKKGNRDMSSKTDNDSRGNITGDKLSKGIKKEVMIEEIVDEWLYQAKHEYIRAFAGDRYTRELRELSKKDIAEKYDAMVSDKTRMERRTWMMRKPMRRW